MEDDEKYSYELLQQRNYRSIQQLAKSLGLPSNFKKIYLVELIHAKKYKSEIEVNNIIHRVKLERSQLSRIKRQNQRKRVQYIDLPSSSRTIFSPPITQTPKRPSHMYMLCNPESSGTFKNPKKNLMHTLNQNGLPSDRVLRSFNMKTVKPNYALLNGQEIKTNSAKETRIKIITNGGFGECVYKKHKPNILNNILKRHLTLSDGWDILSSPTKRQKPLNNMHPLIQDIIPKQTYRAEKLCFQKNDGSVTKINAIIRKTHIDIVPKLKNSIRNTEINTQNLINSKNDELTENILVGSNINDNYLRTQYPNMAAIENNNENNNMNIDFQNNLNNNNNMDVYSVYYHKKIRSEQIRFQKIKQNERLPTIHEVFSRFNNINRNDFSQPLYVQVSTELERSQTHPLFSNRNQYNTIMLETIYNFKNNLVTNAPLLQIATVCKTECVYATPIITTPIVQPSTLVSNDAYAFYDKSYEVDPRLYESRNLQFPEENARRNYYQNEDFNASTSTLDTSQDLNTATLPEMVEDALELISQDGDYMDQITMDVQVQCVFCSWAGPKVMLEYHIRKEHATYIERQSASTWSVSCSLESISTGALLRLVEHNAALYLLRAVYTDTDSLVATLNSLSTETEDKIGSITIYNRISGEPFSWLGQIQPTSPNFVCESNNCLKIELSRLDLLPNSANLKLLNRELVSDSPSKAVVGQPALDEIHLVLFVKIFN